MTTDAIGGVWQYSLELCRQFARSGVQVALAVLGGTLSLSQREQVSRQRNVTLYESQYRLEWMQDPWKDLDEAAGWLLALEAATGADVIHLNHLVHGDLSWAAPVLTVGHSCVFSWWAAVHGEGVVLPAEWQTYKQRVTRSLRASHYVVAPTGSMLENLRRLYGPLGPHTSIFNAVDYRGFKAGHKEPMVLSAGRLWDEAKNVSALAEAAKGIAAPVFVAGEARNPDGRIASFPNVHLLGTLDRPQLAEWYRRAAIYALPARYEPFGLTAVEAAMSGCALVLGDIPSLREVWGPAATYVHPDDHRGLAETLNELLVNESLRKRYAARAMGRARHFTPGRQASQYLSIYRQMIESHRDWPRDTLGAGG
jgi:glycogen(starch) synthase